MNSTQMSRLQAEVGVAEGAEWNPLDALAPSLLRNVQDLLQSCPLGATKPDRRLKAFSLAIPDLECAKILATSTQNAFGQIMLLIGKSELEFSNRVLTTAPDVSTSTNLSGFTNYRGVFSRVLQLLFKLFFPAPSHGLCAVGVKG